MAVTVEPDDLTSQDVVSLIAEHLAEMHANSPEESSHALGTESLRDSTVTFWVARENGLLLGCAALKRLDDRHGEVKSMRTIPGARGRGVGTTLLRHLLSEARRLGYVRLSLETGANDFFAPARRFYERHGFTYTQPFAEYLPDPNSVFMTRLL